MELGARFSNTQNLIPKLSENSDNIFSNFQIFCNTVLGKELPMKKYIGGKQSPVMNKTQSKAIMLRTKLRSFHISMLWQSAWKVTTFCLNIEMWKLLAILVVIKSYAQIDKYN